MATGSHPSGRKVESAEAQSIADRTGRNQEKARKMQAEADRLDMKKH